MSVETATAPLSVEAVSVVPLSSVGSSFRTISSKRDQSSSSAGDVAAVVVDVVATVAVAVSVSARRNLRDKASKASCPLCGASMSDRRTRSATSACCSNAPLCSTNSSCCCRILSREMASPTVSHTSEFAEKSFSITRLSSCSCCQANSPKAS